MTKRAHVTGIGPRDYGSFQFCLELPFPCFQPQLEPPSQDLLPLQTQAARLSALRQLSSRHGPPSPNETS